MSESRKFQPMDLHKKEQARLRTTEDDEDSGLLLASCLQRETEEKQEKRGAAAGHVQSGPHADEEGLLPIMIENFLEKKGAMGTIRIFLNSTGQVKHEFARQLIAEFMGTLLFQIFGGAAPPQGSLAAPANGFALIAIIYCFANISGAHLNPAVSLALMCTGHQKWWKSFAYMVSQILGSIFGSMVYAGLIPGLRVGHHDFQDGNAPGCFGPGPNVSHGEVWGWETMMTFLLVMTVYASAVAKPGHGNTAPLAIGLALYASALTGGPYTGASLNPARTIGPACVFACNVGISFLYIFAEFFGALLGAGLAIFMYGRATTGSVTAQ